jgi:hypothetical protein
VTPDRRAYMREYMRRRRKGNGDAPRKPVSGDGRRPGAPKVYKDSLEPSSPRARKQSPSEGATCWANNETFWEHPDGKVRNYPPELDSGRVARVSWGSVRTAR